MDEIAHYTCHRTSSPGKLDGKADGPAWANAPRSPRFVDMVTGEPGYFDTRAAALWDDDNLYVSFWAQEPFPEARMTDRDGIVFAENDVEIFIDGGDCYYEFELNAANTVYEVFFIWQDAYRRSGRFDVPEFDIIERGALSFAGDYDRVPRTFWRGTHPRGARWAFRDWDLPGLRTAVHVDGRLNDRFFVSKGWSAQIVMPWKGMAPLANGRILPPRDGDVWRMFFGRFEKMTPGGVEIQPHLAWSWNMHGVMDTHLPERFTYVHFSTKPVEDLRG
ncbi:MAG: carbohydrate-binding family 9-like protein [Candidatus Limnocylindrales bacterium]